MTDVGSAGGLKTDLEPRRPGRPENEARRTAPWRRVRRRLGRSPKGLIGVAIVSLVLFLAILGDRIMPHDPATQHRDQRLRPPSLARGDVPFFLLGSDQLGRDVLSRLLRGARISCAVGVTAVVIAATIGVAIGLATGYFGRTVDTILMRFVDGFMAIPNTILTLALVGVVGPGVLTVIFVLGATWWVAYARVVRSEVLGVKTRQFVEAAVAVGQTPMRIVRRHILPNVTSSIIVLATLQVAQTIIAESALSYLGLGVQPPAVTWGSIISDGRDYVATAWWLALFPGLTITVTVLGIIMVGDWLRDLLDPKLR